MSTSMMRPAVTEPGANLFGLYPCADADSIYAAFRAHGDVFPHIRKDYIQRACQQGRCLLDSGIIIIWQQYAKPVRLGDVLVPRGSIMLHQILKTTDASGSAVAVFDRFCAFVQTLGKDVGIYLTVRESNDRARRFYVKVGMQCIGRITWSRGIISGEVYAKRVREQPGLFDGFENPKK